MAEIRCPHCGVRGGGSCGFPLSTPCGPPGTKAAPDVTPIVAPEHDWRQRRINELLEGIRRYCAGAPHSAPVYAWLDELHGHLKWRDAQRQKQAEAERIAKRRAEAEASAVEELMREDEEHYGK